MTAYPLHKVKKYTSQTSCQIIADKKHFNKGTCQGQSCIASISCLQHTGYPQPSSQYIKVQLSEAPLAGQQDMTDMIVLTLKLK